MPTPYNTSAMNIPGFMGRQPRAVAPPRRVVVAADGDTILRVNHVEIRVDSRKLRLHSAEFGRFFDRSGNARGLEGATAAEPYIMLLYEGSPEAMEIICRLLHDEQDVTTGRPSVATFSEFSRLAAKYECVARAKAVAQGWISSFDYKSPGFGQAAKIQCLVQAAWHLDDDRYFEELTEYCMGDRRRLLDFGTGKGLLTAVNDAIGEVIRSDTKWQGHLQRAISEFVNTICEKEADTEEHDATRPSECLTDKPIKCTYARDVRDVCFDKLKEAGIWPQNKQSEDPRELCGSVKRLNPFQDMSGSLKPCDHYKCRRTMLEEINAAARDMCGAAEPKYAGLCLQCCKSKGTYECRC